MSYQGRPPGPGKGRRVFSLSPEVEQEVVAAFQAGTPAVELARRYERASSHIYVILRRAGLRPGLHWKPGMHRDLEQEQKVVALYQHGPAGGAKAIARTLGLSYATVLLILKRHQVEVRHQKIPQAILDRIGELRRNGASQMAISRDVGISQPHVSRALKGLGFQTASYCSGAKHGFWKGGKFLVRGYMRVWLDQAHPFYQAMASQDGYCFEHRLVMAEMLGRPLLPTESVHHIDGNKLNNDRSNLQLRQKYHGKGIVLQCRQCGSRNVEAVELD